MPPQCPRPGLDAVLLPSLEEHAGPRALGHRVQSRGDQQKQHQSFLFTLTSTFNSLKLRDPSRLLGSRRRASVSPGSVHRMSRAVAFREAGTRGGSLVRVPLPSQGPQAAYQGAPGTVGRGQDSSILGVCLRDWQQEAERPDSFMAPWHPPPPHRRCFCTAYTCLLGILGKSLPLSELSSYLRMGTEPCNSCPGSHPWQPLTLHTWGSVASVKPCLHPGPWQCPASQITSLPHLPRPLMPPRTSENQGTCH